MTQEQHEIFVSELVKELEQEITMGRCRPFNTGYAGIVCHAENMADRIDLEWDSIPAIDALIKWAVMATEFWLKGRN